LKIIFIELNCILVCSCSDYAIWNYAGSDRI